MLIEKRRFSSIYDLSSNQIAMIIFKEFKINLQFLREKD